MTRRIAQDLPHDPDVDHVWIADLADAFGHRYFAALDAGEAHASPAWRRAFEAMRDKRTSVLEDLVFAMTVHIVHDLPLALGDLTSGGPPPAAHIYDFHAVNHMMASSVDAVQTAVARRYSPYISWLDRLGSRYDEILTDYGVRMSRGLAWYNADRMADGRSGKDAREAIERSPIELIDNVVRPPIWSARVALRLFRVVVSFLRVWPRPDTTRGMEIAR